MATGVAHTEEPGAQAFDLRQSTGDYIMHGQIELIVASGVAIYAVVIVVAAGIWAKRVMGAVMDGSLWDGGSQPRS